MKFFIFAVALLLSASAYAGTDDDKQPEKQKEVIYIGPHAPCDPCTQPRTESDEDKK